MYEHYLSNLPEYSGLSSIQPNILCEQQVVERVIDSQ